LKGQQTIDIVISTHISQGYAVAQFVVRDLEEEVKARLKRRAERHGRSMEDEIRHILRNAVKESGRPITSLGSRIAARFTNVGLSTDLPELHGQAPRSAEFKP
jgi:plasmid stability protein